MRRLLAVLALLALGCIADAAWHQEPFRPPKRLLHQDKKKTTAVAPPGVQLPSAYIPPHQKRPPGTLLLNMLIKNERDHLKRTLPKWAKIIDYWIIGVDDHNTDDSVEIIQKELGHIPGHIEIVAFDGMGPTWTILVQKGLELFPNATHGIVADADFAPMKDTLDKMQLDIRCSKHMYTIWTQDHKNERKMDWIYRNVPGARVLRRTHQIVEVPELPDQEVFQTLIDLPIEEREGGYGDRSGDKNQRYIQWLEKDLLEYPNDTRTLYYLGYAHFDIYNAARERNKLEQDHWDHLAKSVEYFKFRVQVGGGNEEELWFALLKLGEIYERFYNDWATAESYYKECTTMDPERSDAWFYIGQHYRLRSDPEKALPFLWNAATVEIPERSLFQWHYLYFCLSKLEYGRALLAVDEGKVAKGQLRDLRRILKSANCVGGDPGNVGELKAMRDKIELRLAKGGKGKGQGQGGVSGKEKVAAIKKLLKFVVANIDTLEDSLSQRYRNTQDLGIEVKDKATYSTVLLKLLEPMQKFNKHFRKLEGDAKAQRAFATCRQYRRATAPYLKWIKAEQEEINSQLDDAKLQDAFTRVNAVVRAMCR